MKKTENFQLNQWESTDRILMEDFNGDNAKIDAALAAEDDAREALAGTVAAQAAAMTKLGNCKIYTTSYAGNGGYGSGSPTQITMPEQILLAIVSATRGSSGYVTWGGAMRSFHTTGSVELTTSFLNGGKTVSWYAANNAEQQLNRSGSTYYVTVLTAADR